MAIKVLNIGSGPNSGDGAPLRTVFSDINDNFSDSDNAASRLVQNSPTDTTSGKVLTTDTDIVEVGGLGTASTSDLQTSSTDATSGRVLTTDVDLTALDGLVVGTTIEKLDLTNSNIEFVPDVAPTIDFNFAKNEYFIYDSFGVGFAKKALSDVVTHTRASSATGIDPAGRVSEVSSNVPRLVFDQGEALGYLSEESRTNLLTNSEDFTNIAWIKSRVTISANTIETLSPNGSSSADKMVGTNGLNLNYTEQSLSLTPNTYTATVYVKNSGILDFRLSVVHVGVSPTTSSITLNFASEQTTSSGIITSSSVDKLQNGWYRLSITYNITASVISHRIRLSNHIADSITSNGVDGVYIFGAMVEIGSFPTSYIKTLGTAVVRSADAMTRTLGQEWNPNEGTFVVEFELVNTSGDLRIIGNGTSVRILYVVYGMLYAYDGVNTLNLGAVQAGVKNIVSISISKQYFYASLNSGVAKYSPSHNGNLLSTNQIKMMSDTSAGTVNGTIKRIKYYPRAFDSITLQRLSKLN